MEYRLVPKEGGTTIKVITDRKAAVAVRSEGEERIYLPLEDAETSTYYVEQPSKLVPTEKGYTVFHPGTVSEVEVFSK